MPLTYLALGDSYTIGEQVALADSFPYRLAQMLRQKGREVYAPEIIAKTGWTTDELSAAIDATVFLPGYDMVTLLIGVNDQYRGRTTDRFKPAFELLLQRAIQFAGGDPGQVFVLSIPDWGLTPFAAGKNNIQIGSEIDAFNLICKTAAGQYRCHYIDITTSQRNDITDPAFIAGDGLHPSGREYGKWAEAIEQLIIDN